MRYWTYRRCSGVVLGALALACGNGDDAALFEEEPLPVPVIIPSDTEPRDPPPEDVAPLDDIPPSGEGGEGGENPIVIPPSDGPGEARCLPPAGVSGSPRSLPEVFELMNRLPKPTTLACFLESLDRPLSVFLTSSAESLQPSTGPSSPRAFIINGPLVMTVVPDGAARNTLELGYRTTEDRSIKTEILFPLQEEVSHARAFDRVLENELTVCGRCHVAEIHTDFESFPEGVFESNIIVPSPIFEVRVEQMLPEVANCDREGEPDRCRILSSIFDHGDVRQNETFALRAP